MDSLRALINEELSTLEQQLSYILKDSGGVFEDINVFINGQSKRIRSVSTLLYLKANNITIDNNILNILLSGELIHNASLLHDDVIDESDIRRGEKSFFKKYNVKTAILSGDYILSIAVKKLLELNNTNIIKIFTNATEKMSFAEILQYSKRGNNISKEEYISIIEGKTASLFEAIFESSAIISKIDTNKAKRFGNLFGVLFQINNDMLPESIENDQKNNIITIQNIIGIEKTNDLKDNYKEEMRSILYSLQINEYSKRLEELINRL